MAYPTLFALDTHAAYEVGADFVGLRQRPPSARPMNRRAARDLILAALGEID